MEKRPLNNRLSKKLRRYFRLNGRYLYICDLGTIIVTKCDKVYVLDPDYCVSLSLGNDSVKDINSKIVNELCNKEIVEFANGWSKMVARSKNGKIFIYRFDRKEGILNDNIDQECLENKNIISISCGCVYYLGLSITGEVYEFDLSKNLENQSAKQYAITSLKVNFDICRDKIKQISCGGFFSMALTENGQVFSWGKNSKGQLGLGHTINTKKPQLVRIENVSIERISCGHEHSLLLSSDGDIYVFGINSSGELGIGQKDNQLSPIKLNTSIKYKDIATHFDRSVSIARSTSDVYYIWGECRQKGIMFEPEITRFNSFNEIFDKNLGISFGCQPFDVISQLSDNFIKNGEFINSFSEIEKIGSGSFGTVYKAKYDNLFYYAIKKIPINSKEEFEILKELGITDELKKKYTHENYVVRHIYTWFENNFESADRQIVNEYKLSFYIQMELCDRTLRELINEFNSVPEMPLTPLCYFIATEMFFEILMGIRYLHGLNIIHRDLKPENILLKRGMNGKFIRITDFGLMSFHDHLDKKHKQGVGTIGYIAPEVEICSKYNSKADIYSLGVIMQEMFNINEKSKYEDKESNYFLLMSKYRNASKMSVRMKNQNQDERPNCEEILDRQYLWGLNRHQLDMNESDIEKELLDMESRVLKSSNKSNDESYECYMRSIVNTILFNTTDEFLSWLLAISRYFTENIKYLFIYDSIYTFNWIIVVTKEDKVYEFKSDLLDSMNKKSIVNELCGKELVEIVNGRNHVIARTDKGKIYCWGDNSTAQLGNGKRYDFYDYPKLNEHLKNEYIVSVTCGGYHSLVLTEKGQVLAWGYNESGQIGNGKEDGYQSVPTEVDSFNGEKVKQISCGKYHSMVLTESGHVFTWGDNGRGQLGIGHSANSNKPKLIQLENVFIDKIACGLSHSILLSSEGDIYVFGNNDCSQLGIDSEESQCIPKKLNNSIKFVDIASHSLYSISMAKSINSKIYVWGLCHEIIKEPKEHKFDSFIDIFAEYRKITYDCKSVDDILVFKDIAVTRGVYYN